MIAELTLILCMASRSSKALVQHCPGARIRKEKKKQQQQQKKTHENHAGSERTLYLTVHKMFSVIISQEIPRQGVRVRVVSLPWSFIPLCPGSGLWYTGKLDVVGTSRIFSQSLGRLKRDIEMGGNYLDLLFLLTLIPAHMKNTSHSYIVLLSLQ